MRSELVSQEKNFVTIKVELEVTEFQKSINMTVRELTQKINVPGFRKGKVPRNILEMRVGKEGILIEALESIMPDTIDQIVKDYELDLIDQPEMEIEKLEEGKDVLLTLTFEVAPEVKLPELETIEIEKLKVNVTDEMVDEAIKNMQKQNAEHEKVDRAVEDDDVVEIEYVTNVLDEEGEIIKSHEPATVNVDLGLQDLRPGIKEALKGHVANEKVEATVQVEEDYADPEVAGREIRYDMSIKEIKVKKLPPLEAAFFEKTLGHSVDSEEAFREEVKNRLVDRMTQESDTMAENAAVAKVADKTEVELPETLINRQIEHIKKEDTENAQKRFNKTMEEILAESGMELEDYESRVKDQAERAVRQYLVLDALSESFDISIEKEDFESEVEPLATAYNISTDTLLRSVFKDQNRVMEMGSRIRYKKTTKELLSKVSIKEVEKFSSLEKNTEEDIAEQAE
ncbi:MAG: trigger factor [Aminobacterium colombiense]|jgi:trigger factor|uniref:Trigger factor n=1 Tax=Aminobacterium colombiense (strain DSM 12261 / ALA-1) TaxID=572547 RepID=D5EEP8_AMICL|nr:MULTISPECIES: trigger factor [Aminobacterium]MDD2379493.1 trigger factor [Aminobacterium colombiense]ADE57030.1 trigger factor [Aminobacterium colombiense DSM 12261]MDD3767974.1 trigger factor [Aminobacterium colombiense]MDD4265870.1 trigger factor [Aminobacterium colombiense]MDD4586356.1 trigger factor [Aminobacterium colombiense]